MQSCFDCILISCNYVHILLLKQIQSSNNQNRKQPIYSSATKILWVIQFYHNFWPAGWKDFSNEITELTPLSITLLFMLGENWPAFHFQGVCFCPGSPSSIFHPPTKVSVVSPRDCGWVGCETRIASIYFIEKTFPFLTLESLTLGLLKIAPIYPIRNTLSVFKQCLHKSWETTEQEVWFKKRTSFIAYQIKGCNIISSVFRLLNI